jgi:serine carboxypeptidase-like clade 2
MSKAISSSLLISFLIFSYFVIEINGNKQVKALDNLHKEKYRVNSQIDKSEFEVQDIVYEEAIVHSQEGLKEKDRIKRLPGQPFVKFSQFGGYITLDKSAGSAFYYYFVEAQQSKETLPLLLWLNGGKKKALILLLHLRVLLKIFKVEILY